MTKKLFNSFLELGKYFALTGTFNREIVEKLRNPYRMSRARIMTMRIMKATGLTNFYWNQKLKANNAFDKRFAQPFAQQA